MLRWFVYFLKSGKKDWIYVGMANDVYKRYAEHEKGLVQSTKSYRPLRLAGYIAVPSSQKARELEKAGSGKAILKKRILTDEVPQSGT